MNEALPPGPGKDPAASGAQNPSCGGGAMEHDFVYCPRCTRYSIVHWIRGLGQWECEDCSYKPPKEELVECTTSATSPSLFSLSSSPPA